LVVGERTEGGTASRWKNCTRGEWKSGGPKPNEEKMKKNIAGPLEKAVIEMGPNGKKTQGRRVILGKKLVHKKKICLKRLENQKKKNTDPKRGGVARKQTYGEKWGPIMDRPPGRLKQRALDFPTKKKKQCYRTTCEGARMVDTPNRRSIGNDGFTVGGETASEMERLKKKEAG